MWLERHQVRRAAKTRTLERRHLGSLRQREPESASKVPSVKALERRIEEAVGSADFACAYHHRLFERGASRESPFQLRRARVDAAQRRFAQASTRLEAEAEAWLGVAELDASVDEQSRLAVGRMCRWLAEHPVSKRFPVGDDQAVIATVDVLENALANLRQRRMQGWAEDPFRGVVDAAARQDVTPASAPVTPRHAGVVSIVAHR